MQTAETSCIVIIFVDFWEFAIEPGKKNVLQLDNVPVCFDMYVRLLAYSMFGVIQPY